MSLVPARRSCKNCLSGSNFAHQIVATNGKNVQSVTTGLTRSGKNNSTMPTAAGPKKIKAQMKRIVARAAVSECPI